MKSYLITAACIIATSTAAAQHMHEGGGALETGQSQFAAIAEIVALLREDPLTDWSRVKIDTLREHLIDMDNVTTRTSVKTMIAGETVSFIVTGDGETVLSAQRMATAHAPMLETETGWQVDIQQIADGVQMSVTSSDKDAVSQITGLGFHGLMTIGAHHQQHHTMIALGHDPH
ncbi:hypothetical protein [Tateyamaria omphalii]|uniref:Uncharacterized protein n=1 Tax=Tateyamaria omphalii TaxID=299262 RepID=A0A1P8MYF6_9RHOB|nr:hypothetical protein [Tateyamaria omphalii]APX13012.1 hypothetical protein BWR18_15975 [Tateyamaria omphalii]